MEILMGFGRSQTAPGYESFMRVPSPSNLRSGGDLTQPGFEHVENSGAYSIYLDLPIYLTGVVEWNSLVFAFLSSC